MTKLVYHNYANNNVIRVATAGVIVHGKCHRRELTEKVKVFICAWSPVARSHFHGAALDRNRHSLLAGLRRVHLSGG